MIVSASRRYVFSSYGTSSSSRSQIIRSDAERWRWWTMIFMGEDMVLVKWQALRFA